MVTLRFEIAVGAVRDIADYLLLALTYAKVPSGYSSREHFIGEALGALAVTAATAIAYGCAVYQGWL